MSTIGTTLFSQIEINGQVVNIADLDANNGLYQLPAGYTNATVKYTMIDNSYIPNGVFENNSYITGVKLAYTIDTIASYSFYGVTNINLTDKNSILSINPYAFDAPPEPPTPEPDFYYEEDLVTLNGTDMYSYTPTLVNTTGLTPSFESDDVNVASVDSSGCIYYVNDGDCEVTATATDGTYTYTDSVQVSCMSTPPEPPVIPTINLAAESIPDFPAYDSQTSQGVTIASFSDPEQKGNFSTSDFSVGNITAEVGVSEFISSITNLNITSSGGMYYISASITTNGSGDYDDCTSFVLYYHDSDNVYDDASTTIYCYTETNPTPPGPGPSIAFSSESIEYPVGDKTSHYNTKIGTFWDTEFASTQFDATDFSVMSITPSVGTGFISDFTITNCEEDPNISGTWYLYADITTSGDGTDGDEDDISIDFAGRSPYEMESFNVIVSTSSNA